MTLHLNKSHDLKPSDEIIVKTELFPFVFNMAAIFLKLILSIFCAIALKHQILILTRILLVTIDIYFCFNLLLYLLPLSPNMDANLKFKPQNVLFDVDSLVYFVIVTKKVD